MGLEDLRHELNVVSEIVRHGVHQKVANKIGITREYLYQIRKAKNLLVDTVQNRKLIQSLIDAYREVERDYQREIQEYQREIQEYK